MPFNRPPADRCPIAVRNRRASGFTLVEIMIALFLLVATALVFGIVYPSGAHAKTKAQYYSIALAAAQEKVEDCRYQGYSSLAIQGPTSTAVTGIPSGNMSFTVSQYAANIKKVDVVITWDALGGTGGNLTVSTLISDHG